MVFFDTKPRAKFLGIIIDKKFNWKPQIEDLSKRLSSLAYALYKLPTTFNTDALLCAYYGMVESVLRYGIIFWGNSTNKEVIFKMQKRCVRAMFGLKTMDSCKPYFIEHKILTLPSLYIIEMAIFVKNNPNMFPKLSDLIERNRRDNNIACRQTGKTALLQKSAICMAPRIYNKIPKSLRELNINIFKIKFKKILLDKCYYSIHDFLNDKFLL